MIIIFEGRDGAGKGGTIRAITERLSPRVFKVAALPAPSDREKSQVYLQRYMQHFPAKGEVVIFDRSWYNRAGVEYVMGFCTEEQRKRFPEPVPQDRVVSRRRVGRSSSSYGWKWATTNRSAGSKPASPIRCGSGSSARWICRRGKRWYEYSRARDLMLKKTDTRIAPWHIVRSDDKRTARLNTIAHLLSLIPYKKLPQEKVKLPGRSTKGALRR